MRLGRPTEDLSRAELYSIDTGDGMPLIKRSCSGAGEYYDTKPLRAFAPLCTEGKGGHVSNSVVRCQFGPTSSPSYDPS